MNWYGKLGVWWLGKWYPSKPPEGIDYVELAKKLEELDKTKKN